MEFGLMPKKDKIGPDFSQVLIKWVLVVLITYIFFWPQCGLWSLIIGYILAFLTYSLTYFLYLRKRLLWIRMSDKAKERKTNADTNYWVGEVDWLLEERPLLCFRLFRNIWRVNTIWTTLYTYIYTFICKYC